MNRRRGFNLIALIVFSLFSGGVHGSAILCIEADGRIAFENKGAGCCASAAAPLSERESSANQLLPFPDRESCGPCLDIPIVPERSRSIDLRGTVKLPTLDLAAVSLAGCEGFRLPVVSTPAFPSAPPCSSRLLKLRSVVLRF